MDCPTYEVMYEDISLLADIYDLNKLNFNIVKESMRAEHAYRMIGDPDILTEGFADILSKMGEFFKNMVKHIKEFFRKIFMFIDSQFMEIDKFTKKYKKELDKVKGIKFTIQGYKFTLHDKPDITPFKELVDTYNASIADAKSLKMNDIKLEESEKLSNDNLEKIRGIVLGNNKRFKEDDFSEEVRKYYRDGNDETIEIEVNDSLFRQTINSVEDLVKRKKDAEKYRDQLIFSLTKAEQFFDKKASAIFVNDQKKVVTNKLNYDNDNNSVSRGEDVYTDYGSSDSTINTLNRFIKYKYNYTRTLAGIINIVTNEYCNAYKDNVKMARQIIIGSLKKENIEDKSSAKSDD